jgi:2-keto-4-pentenoate hydratase/2-oxohepta-3-ene-1,7-dioic acid hydratase in catechol pathway
MKTFLEEDAGSVHETLMSGDSGSKYYDREEVEVHAPLDSDGRLFCVGGAYTSHLRESNRSLLTAPHHWVIPEPSIIGPTSSIEIPDSVAEHVVPAIELSIVIGEGGSYIGEADAYDHIAGYTVSNDVTARTDWPGPRGYKIMDTFSPVGPHITTADEVEDPMDLSLTMTLDGTEICTGSTAGHRFTLSFIVSYLSTVFELRPGDIISTGDPGNVEQRLQPGTTVDLDIEEVGTLSNDVIKTTR